MGRSPALLRTWGYAERHQLLNDGAVPKGRDRPVLVVTDPRRHFTSDGPRRRSASSTSSTAERRSASVSRTRRRRSRRPGHLPFSKGSFHRSSVRRSSTFRLQVLHCIPVGFQTVCQLLRSTEGGAVTAVDFVGRDGQAVSYDSMYPRAREDTIVPAKQVARRNVRPRCQRPRLLTRSA
jgi:hypothetical protein